MGSFQYKSGATWYDVPDAAKPDTDGGSVMVVYPEATARDGQGNPCGAVGQAKIVIKFSRMTGTGMDFWRAFFASAIALTAAVTGVTAFDPRSGTWQKYSGTLLRPTFETVQAGSTALRTWYKNGEITIDSIAGTG